MNLKKKSAHYRERVPKIGDIRPGRRPSAAHASDAIAQDLEFTIPAFLRNGPAHRREGLLHRIGKWSDKDFEGISGPPTMVKKDAGFGGLNEPSFETPPTHRTKDAPDFSSFSWPDWSDAPAGGDLDRERADREARERDEETAEQRIREPERIDPELRNPNIDRPAPDLRREDIEPEIPACRKQEHVRQFQDRPRQSRAHTNRVFLALLILVAGYYGIDQGWRRLEAFTPPPPAVPAEPVQEMTHDTATPGSNANKVPVRQDASVGMTPGKAAPPAATSATTPAATAPDIVTPMPRAKSHARARQTPSSRSSSRKTRTVRTRPKPRPQRQASAEETSRGVELAPGPHRLMLPSPQHRNPLTDLAINVQRKLSILGYPTAHLTGKFDFQTRMAIREFQTNSNLPSTGEVDSRTLELLNRLTMR